MTDQNERQPTAIQMWSARQGVVISGIAVDRAHRTEVDLARAEVERLSSELAMSVGIVTQLDIENQRLNRDNDELRRMCEIVERIQGERDRARDLAIRNGAFQPEGAWSSRLLMIVDRLTDERDQALYERDQCLEAVEFSRGLIPTRPR